jgi:hypothetical protein
MFLSQRGTLTARSALKIAPPVGCPPLHIQHICSYSLYVERGIRFDGACFASWLSGTLAYPVAATITTQ